MTAEQDNENVEVLADQAVEGELLESDSKDEVAPEEPLSDAEAEHQALEALKHQAQENLDKALRAQAELDNVRKRSLRDVENAHKYALDKFANELLPVIDSLELGIDAADNTEEQNTLKEGMKLTLKMFRDVMEKHGVKEVESEGEKFDPEKHEAVSMQEMEGSESGFVIAVLQKGYALNGRLIRPAMVVVAK
jgi:molecular chaperone GrpE